MVFLEKGLKANINIRTRILNLANYTFLKLLVILKHEVDLRDLLEIRNFSCKYWFTADTVVGDDFNIQMSVHFLETVNFTLCC